MSGKKVCINCSSSYYTGKEQSPLHFGLSAEGYEINSIMEGFDKDLWIVEVRNSKKVWTKKEHINKMTYETPLISEITDKKEVSTTSEIAIKTIKKDVELNNTADNITTNSPFVSNNIEDTIATINNNTDNIDDNTKNKEKVSKIAKPTDYTLFITYRIHQMKEVSTDNKKNYDCARLEWKEYKKKPEELRLIMIEANNYQKNDYKLNKK